MIPKFPEFKEIEIGDRRFLKDRIWNYQPENSEMNFTNLFIWKDHLKVRWTVFKDTVLFMCGDRPYFLETVGKLEIDDLKSLSSWISSHNSEIVFDRVAKKFTSLLNDDFKIIPSRDQFDYVYKAEDLINLAGRKYHSKRNHLSNFLKMYHYQYLPMTGKDAISAVELAKKWCEEKRCKDDMNLLDEFEATKLALENFDELELKGAMILIDGEIQAFTLGEMLNQNTFVIHIEKANKAYEGIYVAINNLFCKNNLNPGMFVNREQDLGDEGLRKAKLSYFPDHFVEKFSVLSGNSL
ncbi:DUF2156 domain-containing protein [Athalassotoga saccharophila]|uniref:DUF2156 domain-containing protein n=1 Tax=Athalassotoga saccharophila TaxID=1441386 RepID=UPI001379FE8B|nr:phosphatidylglycerol lysyltransferase domain-containing protein [Athalassotoga saccharophila]BBJ27190.1 hypothetical protein ATHSA_0058 [Athalassotoga saccharophila]